MLTRASLMEIPVQTHQLNHLRIQALRKSSAALDAQIRDTLSSLSSTRKDIVTTHTTTYPLGPSYPIAYEELLSYARRISKTTMPPAATINSLPPAVESQTPAPDSQLQSAVTAAAPTPSQTQSPAAVNGMSRQFEQSTQQTALSMNTSLPEVMTQYLNPLSGQAFLPWPLEDKIRSGSLASNQILVERGIEPRGYDPAEEEERKRKEEEERKEKEEKEKADREERERKIMEEREKARQERERQREREQAEWRRGSVVAGPAAPVPGLSRTDTAPGEKKQFQFTNLDDLDDDDEE